LLFRFPCAGDAIKTLPPAPLLPGQPAPAVGQLSAATAKSSSSRESQADTSDRSPPGRASVHVPASGKAGGKASAKAGSQRGTSAPRDATPTTFKERKVGT
jgi:hypothetical protein